jgi:TPR repeat protein
MQDLAHQRFPPAMYMIGLWESKGEHLAQDSVDGLSLIQKAASKNYGPALYEVAIRQVEGRDLPQDFGKGLDLMRQAAMLGSPQAQFHLGVRYEKGDGVAPEPDRARRYYRLCATQGISFVNTGLASCCSTIRRGRNGITSKQWLGFSSRLSKARRRRKISRVAKRQTSHRNRASGRKLLRNNSYGSEA